MKTKKGFAIIGIIMSIGAIITGICILAMSGGLYTRYASFGGDFYTYIYEATSRATDNLKNLIKVVKVGFGMLFMLGGCGGIASFGIKLGEAQSAIDNAAEKARVQLKKNMDDAIPGTPSQTKVTVSEQPMATVSEWTCEGCGNINKAGAFCAKCGNPRA